MRDREALLRACLTSLQASLLQYPNAYIVVVDNGSTDGSFVVGQAFGPRVSSIQSLARSIGGVRNAGAQQHGIAADAFVFVDCDCIVRPDFLPAVASVFHASGADAVGCEVISPADGHWTEVTSDALHRVGGDSFREYINSACFAVKAEAFKSIGGFDEQMTSSEDVDICRRLLKKGFRIFHSESLRVVHLGNPKSTSGFYKRLRWHGEGAAQARPFQLSRTIAAAITHLLVSSVGLAVAVTWTLQDRNLYRAGLLLIASFLAVPTLFVAARAAQLRRPIPIANSIALMTVSMFARSHGLLRSLRRRA
ncbi:MAG: glycosyltransferase [Gemmatimonadaceae bacterium]|nr:glycosyltransferase [Gemmatimonadaceae bacterium]